MRVDREHLSDQIENILVKGICTCEEVDITTERIMKMIWPYFEYVESKELCTACSGSGYYCGVHCGSCNGTGQEID